MLTSSRQSNTQREEEEKRTGKICNKMSPWTLTLFSTVYEYSEKKFRKNEQNGKQTSGSSVLSKNVSMLRKLLGVLNWGL